MSVHTPSFGAAARATTPDLIGTYEFKIGSARLFKRNKEIDGEQVENAVYGVGYPLTVSRADDPDDIGLNVYVKQYCHSEKAAGMVKQFLMCANGYDLTPEGEAEWNESENADDQQWTIDLDNDEIGPGWDNIGGGTIAAMCSIKVNDGRKNQNYRWQVPA